MNKYKLLLMFAMLLVFSACNQVWDEHSKINDNVSQQNILDYLESNADFSSFVQLLKSTGMDATLSSSGIFTVWAPTNQALAAMNQSLIGTDEKKKLFVANHIVFGSYSAISSKEVLPLKMRSSKVLTFNGVTSEMDGKKIDTTKENTVKNGVIQVVNEVLAPRLSMWDYIILEAPSSLAVDFLRSQNVKVFDRANSVQTGINAQSRPIYDSVFVIQNPFILSVADLSSEDSTLTMIIPTNEVFSAQFNKYQKYYRRDDKVSNVNPTSRDSIYIKLMILRDMVFENAHTANDAADTLVSYFGVKVPFNKSAITKSISTSNGLIHYSSDCDVRVSDKILPLKMEAESCFMGTSYVASGTPEPYYRQRVNASNGYDFILDNSHSSQILTGALFVGPVVSSIKYRVKIRAINDFRKSYRNGDAAVVLRQFLGQVTISRDPITDGIKTISTTTNPFNSSAIYGTPDAVYDPVDLTSYYVPIEKTSYSPVDQAEVDEIDLGYYDFAKADNVFLRLIPLSSKMAVTADYFRLVPIIE